jgi:hypothetical protein
MTLGEVLFNSRAVGRLGSLLFLSIALRPVCSRVSVRAAIQAITHQRDYLQTSFRIAVKLSVVSGII